MKKAALLFLVLAAMVRGACPNSPPYEERLRAKMPEELRSADFETVLKTLSEHPELLDEQKILTPEAKKQEALENCRIPFLEAIRNKKWGEAKKIIDELNSVVPGHEQVVNMKDALLKNI